MTRTPVVALAALTAAVAALLAATPAAQRTSRERALYVSVVDQSGTPVQSLEPTDVIVREDNVAREVLRVQRAEDPMQVALLVDTSAAARDHIQYFRQAMPALVAELTRSDEGGRRNEVAIIGMGERPTILSEYSSDPKQIEKGTNRIFAFQSTGLYVLDALYETAQGLKKRGATRPVIVVVTTSGPDFSNRHHDQVLDAVKSAGAAVYAILLGQPDTSMTDEARERAIVMDRGPKETGGYSEQLLASLALTSRVKILGAQLTHQFKVTYGRPDSLIPPEKITVAAAKPGLTARGTPVREEGARK